MEGSQSEAVFDSLNINPQLFINSVVNVVNDGLDVAFDLYKREVSALLENGGVDRSEDLSQAVSGLHGRVQGLLNKQLDIWEKYSFEHVFLLPDGFTLSNVTSNELNDNVSLSLDDVHDDEADRQLSFLRENLSRVGRESVRLQRELNVLQDQSLLNSAYLNSLSEALQPLEQQSVHDMFAEMIKSASELRKKSITFESRSNGSQVARGISGEDKNLYMSVLDRKGLSLRIPDVSEFIISGEPHKENCAGLD